MSSQIVSLLVTFLIDVLIVSLEHELDVHSAPIPVLDVVEIDRTIVDQIDNHQEIYYAKIEPHVSVLCLPVATMTPVNVRVFVVGINY